MNRLSKALKYFTINFLIQSAIILGWGFLNLDLSVNAKLPSIFLPTEPIPEASDYATRVLGDPWDMNEYSDISQYLNESGQRNVIINPRVDNGIFIGTSAGDVSGNPNGAQNGWFFVLFPGYRTAIHSGRAGSKFPIDSTTYQCLYIAMNVESPAPNSFGPDQYRVFWFGDDRLNQVGAPYGFTRGIQLYPEYGSKKPVPFWKLYKIELSNAQLPMGVPGIVSWRSQRYWQGLRIDPTINANVLFKVDWVRLTSCQPQTISIKFTPDSRITSLWLRPKDANYYIRIATDVSGSSGEYLLDTQGIAPGSYWVSLGTELEWGLIESESMITIKSTPVVKFESPAGYSGNDYAASTGNPWDMSSTSDYQKIECASSGLSNGLLWITTKPGNQQPSSCKGGVGEADPKLFLNVSSPINPAEYRYFSIKFNDTNPWQYVPKGMIMRLIWTVQGDSAQPGRECHLVSHDIPYDVGWHVYTIDLWDDFAGSAEGWQGECNSLPKNWRQSSPILKLRIDPNENITDHEFYQEIDWIRITKPTLITRGEFFRILLKPLLSSDDIKDIKIFYTVDPRNAPTQFLIESYTQPSQPAYGQYTIFLPIVMNGASSQSDPNLIEFIWSTNNVSPGEYYLCAQVSDGLNQSISCSETPVIVTP